MSSTGYSEVLLNYSKIKVEGEGSSTLLGVWSSVVGPKNTAVLLRQHSSVDRMIYHRAAIDHHETSK